MGRRQLSRDGLLAAATCMTLLLGARSMGVGWAVFAKPLLAGVGCAGMVVIEVVLLRYPEQTRRLWERRVVRVTSVLGVLVGGAVAASVGAVWVVAVLVWGLVAYLGLVVIVAVSGRNPLARVG
jgi:hypothetical protein